MIGNLKGNLEMCLSARLGTSATLGELDTRKVRRGLVVANMTLLGLQALLISCLAAVLSFFLGLITTHRLGDVPAGNGFPAMNTTIPGTVADPSVNDPWREGTTRPGSAQLVMVLATGMGAAGISALVLGSFMCSLVVICRWWNIDPDNITPPVAACLGDLVTLFVLALIGTLLVGAMDTPVPLISVILMTAAAFWFTRRVMRDEWVKNIARGSWIPLVSCSRVALLTPDWSHADLFWNWNGLGTRCRQISRFRAPRYLHDWPHWLHRGYPCEQAVDFASPWTAYQVQHRPVTDTKHGSTVRARLPMSRCFPAVRQCHGMDRRVSRLGWVGDLHRHDYVQPRHCALLHFVLLGEGPGSRVSLLYTSQDHC